MGNVKLAMNEGLTGWVAREKRLLAISREAFRDPRFKFFSDLPEDTYEAFLSAPVLSRRGVEGVINVQHRDPHSHTGIEMELLTSVGEQLGCLVDAVANRDSRRMKVRIWFAPTARTKWPQMNSDKHRFRNKSFIRVHLRSSVAISLLALRRATLEHPVPLRSRRFQLCH